MFDSVRDASTRELADGTCRVDRYLLPMLGTPWHRTHSERQRLGAGNDTRRDPNLTDPAARPLE